MSSGTVEIACPLPRADMYSLPSVIAVPSTFSSLPKRVYSVPLSPSCRPPFDVYGFVCAGLVGICQIDNAVAVQAAAGCRPVINQCTFGFDVHIR
ncbi:Uncharacterised protein [Neisseria gonorrhoeae]|uniref:Uncharacterized protein n=1 Tax=Neisseria gonorrhoeae TaxID=485 RepID=A0A378VV44_NEIGO|nr:Uncharacterised protein [Neisseria gonorrhoeae]